jgi:hypothetical protein
MGKIVLRKKEEVVETLPDVIKSPWNQIDGTLTRQGFLMVFWTINFKPIARTFIERAILHSDIFPLLNTQEYREVLHRQLLLVKARSERRDVSKDQQVIAIRKDLHDLFARLISDIKRLELQLDNI